MTHRIEQLYQFALEDPDDPFNWYALALEYMKTDTGKSIEIFNRILSEHQEYVPMYYHLGKLYQEEGKNNEALQTFELGIQVAGRQKDFKAVRELTAAIQELQIDSSE